LNNAPDKKSGLSPEVFSTTHQTPPGEFQTGRSLKENEARLPEVAAEPQLMMNIGIKLPRKP
jgi:hypothetical protein